MRKIILIGLLLFSYTLSFSQNINEFHYDNAGGDVGEFVEIYIDGGTAGADVSGFTVTLYNGSNGTSYGSETLDDMTETCDADGCYYVWNPSSIQNGGPDGIALSGPVGLMEFLSYEGTFTATNGIANGTGSTDVGVSETSSTPIGASLALVSGAWEVDLTESPGEDNDPAPLPISLALFTAESQDDAVALSWTTASEENNDYFSIEHSTDGINYTEIDYVKGAGTSFLENNYDYFHRNPAKGSNYYRLAQVDYNRSINYSSVEVVEITGGDLFTLYPTLTKGEVTLNFSEEFTHDTTIEVYDLMGRQVIAAPLEDQVSNQNLDVSQLQNGHYLLRLQAAGQAHTVRFIKY